MSTVCVSLSVWKGQWDTVTLTYSTQTHFWWLSGLVILKFTQKSWQNWNRILHFQMTWGWHVFPHNTHMQMCVCTCRICTHKQHTQEISLPKILMLFCSAPFKYVLLCSQIQHWQNNGNKCYYTEFILLRLRHKYSWLVAKKSLYPCLLSPHVLVLVPFWQLVYQVWGRTGWWIDWGIGSISPSLLSLGSLRPSHQENRRLCL